MRVLITRHYKTLVNASEQILGWGDSPRVSGWEADLLFVDTQLRNKGIKFDAVYASNLERSRQTATFHAGRHGIDVIHNSCELNEVNYGSLYKKKKKWVAEHYPQHKTDPDFVYPKGESFRQMQQRSVSFFTSLAALHPHETILVVAHAGVIRGLVSHYLGLNYAENLKRKVSHRYIGDFQFDGSNCVRYDELGKLSGFIRNGTISVPFECPLITASVTG